jgi:hypothetical protein
MKGEEAVAGFEVVEAHRGISDQTLQEIFPFLPFRSAAVTSLFKSIESAYQRLRDCSGISAITNQGVEPWL